ncbi:DNA polymerase III subunit gamma/tau [uncultured Microscilla sp.]|uniref:DNA polymerase III subunit gamma/tau n=1 Tax=uncultured Microscilla sp. TaxID=432653 RepID=UPI0026054C7C|nr:DNA polymerase III subunit gamma/tau [uncultured Microscilla sp.]
MENFVVSARKYRPATFDTVVGQSHITTTLKNAIKSNQLAQAFLFCGPRGVGKTTCARILAKTINCLTPTEDFEACGTCESCVSFQNQGSMNVYELDAASSNSVDDIRNLVDQVRYPPQSGKRKVYIIDEVHMLSNSAFNAFLKTLEEPPEYVIFILATTEKHKIIPTILSRCQIFDFKRIEVKDMSGHLANIAQKEEIEAEQDALDLIAQKADGGLRDALSLFDLITTFSADRNITYQSVVKNLHILDHDYYFKITDALLAQDMPLVLLYFDEILRKGFDGHIFIAGLGAHLRNVMMCKDPATVKLLEVSEKVKQRFAEQAQNASASFLLSALNLANDCDLHYKSSKNPRFFVELVLMKMANLNRVIDWAQNPVEIAGQPPADPEKKKPETNVTEQNNSHQQQQAPPPAKMSLEYTKKENPKTPIIPNKPDATLKVDTSNGSVQASDNTPFTKKELLLALNDFKGILRNFPQDREKARKAAEYLSAGDISIENGHEITLTFSDEAQEKVVAAYLEKVQKNLRNKLNNQALTLSSKYVYVEKKKKIYTPYDKFQYLKEKHTKLNDLSARFGLEVDL